MDQTRRFVFAGPGSWTLEQAIRWAVERGFRRVDFNADTPPNYPATFAPERIATVRDLIAQSGVQVGLHTLSAVNMAEITPTATCARTSP